MNQGKLLLQQQAIKNKASLQLSSLLFVVLIQLILAAIRRLKPILLLVSLFFEANTALSSRLRAPVLPKTWLHITSVFGSIEKGYSFFMIWANYVEPSHPFSFFYLIRIGEGGRGSCSINVILEEEEAPEEKKKFVFVFVFDPICFAIGGNAAEHQPFSDFFLFFEL